jgi:4-amino-4-deoxy-L-arabinose transferase-like glycosyltransferase
MREGLIGRFTTQSSLHVEGLFYYVLHLPHLLGPVILFLPLLVIGWFKTASAERRGPLGLFVIAAVTVFLVFCLFPSKRTHYLVPLLPPLALAFGLVVGRERYDEGRYLTRSTLVFAILFALLVLAWNVIGLRPLNLQGVVRAWTAFVLLAGLGAGSWVLLRAGRRGMAWRVSWVGVVMGMSFFIGDVYPRLRNPLSPRTFSEAVARVTPPQARLGSLSSHGALIYYLARPVEVIPLSSADAFLESPDHYLIVDDEDLPRIAEEHRQIVFAQSPYGHHDAAYLLRGGGLTGDSIKPVMCHNEQALAVLSWSSTLKDFWLRMVRAFMPIPPVKARPGVP